MSLLRVLIIDDSEDDATLLARELRRGPWEVMSLRVDTPAAMRIALDAHPWDLIIADYSMPHFSGPAALVMAREHALEMPFILVSGKIGEEIAVKAMKAGADDYMVKGDLARLVPAVEREIRDADGRHRARSLERQLQKRDAQLADAQRLAHLGTWHIDVRTNVAVWSCEACRILGRQIGQPAATFQEFLGYLPPNEVCLFTDPLRAGDQSQIVQDFQIIRPNATARFVHVRGDIIRDESGIALEATGMIQDITEQRTAEQEMRASEGRYRTLFEYAPDGIVIANKEDVYIDANPSVCRMLGYTRDELIGRHSLDIVAASEAPQIVPSLGLMCGESDYTREWQFKRKDGSVFPGEVITTLMPDGNLMGMIRDITERKAVEKELHKVKAAAEAANRAKSEFLANMSHEIRTPMTAMIGFAEMMLQRGQDPADRNECVQTILRNAKHLLELINAILDLSKIEAGEMTIETIPCDLPQLLADVLWVMRPRAADMGLTFAVTFQGPIPRQILTDPLRFRQILLNLIGNAIKFTSAGRVGIRLGLEGQGSEQMLRIDVMDSGIGMSGDQLARLFRPFTQADESTTRRFGGTGLGLTISQQLAQLLGGDIVVQSELGVGSTFTVRIKSCVADGVEMIEGLTEACLPHTITPSFSTEVSLRGRVLLAEDGRDNQRLLSTHLRLAGATVEIAENGQLAVDMAMARPFDLVLMDMQMPVMDGYSATAELRRRQYAIPIVAITANAMAEDRQKCLASGCSDYLTKPISRETLLRKVSEYLGHAPVGGTQEIETPAPGPSLLSDGTIISTMKDYPGMEPIIKDFVAGLPEEVAKMHQLLDEQDLQALRRVVHQLRGSGGGYGFDSVSDLAESAETAITAVDDLESIKSKIIALVGVMQRIEGFDGSQAVASGSADEASRLAAPGRRHSSSN